jgi:hypothetical protein
MSSAERALVFPDQVHPVVFSAPRVDVDAGLMPAPPARRALGVAFGFVEERRDDNHVPPSIHTRVVSRLRARPPARVSARAVGIGALKDPT